MLRSILLLQLGKGSVDSSEPDHNTAALTLAVEALAPEHPLGVMDAAKSVASSLLVDAVASSA